MKQLIQGCTFATIFCFVVTTPLYQSHNFDMPKNLLYICDSICFIVNSILLAFIIIYSIKLYFLLRNNMFFPLMSKSKFLVYCFMIIIYLVLMVFSSINFYGALTHSTNSKESYYEYRFRGFESY